MDILTTILIAGFFFIMGAAIIGLIWYLQGLSKRARGISKDAASSEPDLEELARLMRHLQTQDLVVKIDGKTFNAAHELTPAKHSRLTFISNVLATWLTQPAPEPQATEASTSELQATGESTPESVMPPAGEVPMMPFPIPAEAEHFETRPAYTPPFATEAVEEVKPVSTALPDLVGGFLSPTSTPAPEFKSIAAQINDILQIRLSGTALESRGISLSDTPDHDVMVSLDGKQYPGVVDVPDEEVRAAIRAAVLEWETKK